MNSTAPQIQPQMQPQHPLARPRLLILGDSLAIGAAEVQGRDVTRTISPAYPDLLRQHLPEIDIVVEADVQRNSTSVCTRLDEWLAAHRPTIVLAAVGGSDADVDWRRFVLSDGSVYRSRTSVEKYITNLRFIAEHVASVSASLILIEPSNQDVLMRGTHISALSGRDVSAMIAAVGGQPECDRRLQEYRNAVAEVAKQTGAQIVPCAIDWTDGNSATVLCEDGAHVNEHAHQLLAESYLAPIRRAIAISPSSSLRLPA